jgi:hypothetical protein
MDELRLSSCNQVSSKQFVNLPGFFEKFLRIFRLKAQLLGNG